MTPALLATTGVIPFTETIFLPQSLLLAAILVVVSVGIAWLSAPTGPTARTADALGVDPRVVQTQLPPRTRPGDWLERSPVLNLLLLALGAAWLIQEISGKGLALAISSLNTYNFLPMVLFLLWLLGLSLTYHPPVMPAP